MTDSCNCVLTRSGPINTLAVHPTGKAYASGAEDGFVRVFWVRATM
jgi:translation initiation factor 3 subunit I